MEKLKIKRLTKTAVMPHRATEGAAGFDVCADIESPIAIGPGERVLVPTGLSMEVPDGSAAFCFARSGLAIKHGITLSNSVGVIDSDYRGEVKIGLVNLSDIEYVLNPGERMAQIVIMSVQRPEIEEAFELSETARGSGGFGSTGRN